MSQKLTGVGSLAEAGGPGQNDCKESFCCRSIGPLESFCESGSCFTHCEAADCSISLQWAGSVLLGGNRVALLTARGSGVEWWKDPVLCHLTCHISSPLLLHLEITLLHLEITLLHLT